MTGNFCAGAIIKQRDRYLFGKRHENKSWYPGKWDIFGGHSSASEEPFDTLTRELFEELGITDIKARLKATLIISRNSNEKLTYYIYVVYQWSGEPANCSMEHSEIRWFTRAELDSISLASREYLNLIDDMGISDFSNFTIDTP